MTCKIRSIRQADGGGAVALTVEELSKEGSAEKRQETFLLSAGAFDRRLHKGDIIDSETVGQLRLESRKTLALRRGSGILAYGANSRRRLTQKLMQKGFSYDEANCAAEQLDEKGLIDEESASLRDAELMVRQNRGRKAIYAKLCSRGYRQQAVDRANEYLDTVDFSLICLNAIKKQYGDSFPHEKNERDRAVATLIRRGFSLSDIKKALERI